MTELPVLHSSACRPGAAPPVAALRGRLMATLSAVRDRPGMDRAVVPVVVGAGIVAALQVGKAAIAAPLLQADFGIGLGAVGWLTAIFAVLGTVGGIPVGAVVAAIGDRRVLLLGLAATVLGSAAGALSGGYAALLGSRVIEGLGFLLVTVAGPAVLRRVVAPERRDIAFAFWSCYMPAGMALAMLAAPLFPDWQATWWCVGALAVAAFSCVALAVPRPAVGVPLSWQALGRDAAAVMRAGGPPLLATTFTLYSLMFFALFSFLPVLLMDRMGVSLRTAGLLSAVATSANIVGNLCAGLLLSRGVARSALIGAASLAMAAAGLGIFLNLLPDTPTFLLCVLFSGVGGLIPATLLATTPQAAPAERLAPVALGLVMQGSNIGQVVGPVAVGGAIDAFGWPAAAAIVGTAGLAGFILALALRRTLRQGTI